MPQAKLGASSSLTSRGGKATLAVIKQQQPDDEKTPVKMKPSSSRVIRRNITKKTMKKAPKRRREDPPGSCGKPGDPHDVEDGELAKAREPLPLQSRRRLDARYVGAGGRSRQELAAGL